MHTKNGFNNSPQFVLSGPEGAAGDCSHTYRAHQAHATKHMKRVTVMARGMAVVSLSLRVAAIWRADPFMFKMHLSLLYF